MERKISLKKNMALLTWLSKPIDYFSQNWLSAKRSIDPVSRLARDVLSVCLVWVIWAGHLVSSISQSGLCRVSR